MVNSDRDTIFALSSGAGRAGVSVMRISGPLCKRTFKALTGEAMPRPRLVVLRAIYDDIGALIDRALIFWFEAPKSFTGEDCLELHLHGSEAVVEACAQRLLGLGLRHAKAGEFTRRAVENNKMDLTEAEGLADLIDAQNTLQRQQALTQMDGGLRQLYEGWAALLLDASAQIEGEIDFADEADVPNGLSHAAAPYLQSCKQHMQQALKDRGRAQAIRQGIEIALIGRPNAGKSTVMNHLAGRDVAITAPQAGTTRDLIEAPIRLGGVTLTLIDMAGLRVSDNPIEAEGVRRAVSRAKAVQIRLFILRPDLDEGLFNQLAALEIEPSADDLIYVNISKPAPQDTDWGLDGKNLLIGNGLMGENIDAIERYISDFIAKHYSLGENAGLTRQRHADCVQKALAAIMRGLDNLSIAPELVSEDIRAALQALEELAGRTDIEQVFDRIFSRFCIGK